MPRRKNQRPTNANDDNDNIGEVIQDRFNPKPWFGYEPSTNNNDNKGPTYIPPPSSNTNDKPPSSQDLTVPFDTFPLSLKPDTNSNNPGMNINDDSNSPQKTKNSYGSMYTSYDPPPALNHEKPENFVTYEAPAKNIKPPKYLPPEPESNNPPESPPENPMKYMPETGDTDTDDGPPISQIYNHPYHHHHQQHYPDSMKDEEIAKFPGLPAYLDHEPSDQYKYHHQQYYHDVGPPIYHEIKTTTEAPVAEDQRLNKKPYSYYYLGRKLWYVPLYFSVYFIIYIFVLILKSIARHKITFNHYFEDDKRDMKDVVTMVPPVPHHVAHELADHVWDDIHAARRKYIM